MGYRIPDKSRDSTTCRSLVIHYALKLQEFPFCEGSVFTISYLKPLWPLQIFLCATLISSAATGATSYRHNKQMIAEFFFLCKNVLFTSETNSAPKSKVMQQVWCSSASPHCLLSEAADTRQFELFKDCDVGEPKRYRKFLVGGCVFRFGQDLTSSVCAVLTWSSPGCMSWSAFLSVQTWRTAGQNCTWRQHCAN